MYYGSSGAHRRSSEARQAFGTPQVVDELAAAGLAERQADQADGRSSFAALTPPGKDALRRAWPVYRAAIRRRIGAHLTSQQRRDLAALLEHAAAGAQTGLPAKASR